MRDALIIVASVVMTILLVLDTTNASGCYVPQGTISSRTVTKDYNCTLPFLYQNSTTVLTFDYTPLISEATPAGLNSAQKNLYADLRWCSYSPGFAYKTSDPSIRNKWGIVSCDESAVFPTAQPTSQPTTSSPTSAPTTVSPTQAPTEEPTTSIPTSVPTRTPSKSPTRSPVTLVPTGSPSKHPSKSPTTSYPSASPTTPPTESPITVQPTSSPITVQPTSSPMTVQPTSSPILRVTSSPSSDQKPATSNEDLSSSVMGLSIGTVVGVAAIGGGITYLLVRYKRKQEPQLGKPENELQMANILHVDHTEFPRYKF